MSDWRRRDAETASKARIRSPNFSHGGDHRRHCWRALLRCSERHRSEGKAGIPFHDTGSRNMKRIIPGIAAAALLGLAVFARADQSERVPPTAGIYTGVQYS